MFNSFYTTEIADKIVQLLKDNTTVDEARNISVGDLSILPSPQEIGPYLPIVLVNPGEVDSDVANQAWNISRVLYPFTIYYVSAYNFKMQDELMRVKIKEGEKLANILNNNYRLGDFTIPQTSEEIGGMVIDTKVTRLGFDNAATELFEELDVNACLVEINFLVMFSTYNMYGGVT